MLLPWGQRLPWKSSSSFASAVTAPMVTQAPWHGRWCISHLQALTGVGLPVAGKVWEAAGKGGGGSGCICVYLGSAKL